MQELFKMHHLKVAFQQNEVTYGEKDIIFQANDKNLCRSIQSEQNSLLILCCR